MKTVLRFVALLALSCIASGPGHAAAPFRLFEVGASRFTSDGRVENGRINALGQYSVDFSGPSATPSQMPTEWHGKILIFTEAWHAYRALGSEATANFRLADNGKAYVVAGLLYYEVEPHPQARRDVGNVINLSTRGTVAAGGVVSLMGGFVIEGQPRRVFVRAIGPSLAPFNVTDAAGDVAVTLRRGETVLQTNSDWAAPASVAAVEQAAVQVGAFPLVRGSKDAAILVELPPGNYSASVATENGAAAGSALLEIYVMP